MNILLVEPDRLLARTYYAALSERGHQVNICATAQAAIFCADEQRPDLVILELQLVSHSGIEFLYEFRSYQDWDDVPVIINTYVPPREFSESQTLLQEQLGIKAYYYKPVTTLFELVRSAEKIASLPAATI